MSTRTVNHVMRTLHHLALASPSFGETLFDVDSRLARQDVRHTDAPQLARHAFIVGLPRGGNSVISRLVKSEGSFCALSRRDMPFVMAPNLWARLSRWQQMVMPLRREQARLSTDIVLNATNSALDEVFWRIHCGADYIRPNHLARIDVADEVIGAFRRYVDNILVRYGKRRYLSNNPNNVLRLAALREAFPRAVIVVPFRDPLRHANALLQQHRHWQQRHRSDPFARGMTRWLAYHQFGADHRPYFDAEPVSPEAADHIDYWLRQWIRVHLEVERQVTMQRLLPIASERLADEPQAFWAAFGRMAGLFPGRPMPTANLQMALGGPLAYASPVLLEVAEDLYRRLDLLSVQALKEAGQS